MKTTLYNFLTAVVLAGSTFVFTSCNKDAADPVPLTIPTPSATGRTVADTVNNDANLTIFKAAVARASTSTASPTLSALLSDRTAEFTVFAPTDAAFQQAFALLGIPSALGINAFRPGQLDTILRYHVVSGKISSAMIPTTFPNAQLPTQFVLQAPSAAVPPGLRMSVFASRRAAGAWVNNVPIIQADIAQVNGYVHKIAAVLLPPSQFLWDRVNTDANLTYLKAAIQRADSGSTASLQAALLNPAANLTLFAPTDAAMKTFLTASITQALIARNIPPATAQAAATALVGAYGTLILTNPISIPDAPIFPQGTGIGLALATALSPTNVKGIAVYHLFGNRAFTVNFPTTATPGFPTLLNTVLTTHPGVTLQATFGTTGVTAATIKGLTNATPSNILINPLPAPSGTSDQHYINGVLHVIDQALQPQ